MTLTQIISLLPLIIISIAPITIMICIAIGRSHRFTYLFTLLSFLVAISTLFLVANIVPVYVSSLLVIDSFSLFYMGLIFAAGFVITMMAYNYWKDHPGHKEEYYILLLVATLGSAVLTSANHFVSLFLGIETLSVSLYAMIAYLRHREISIEAATKYLIIAAVSSAFLLFGMGLVYTGLGTMGFYEIGTALSASGSISPIVLTGFAMMIVGIGFKLAIVPFHMWTPDVYEGAPAPVSAFIASISKGGVFAVLLRFFIVIEAYNYKPLVIIFTVLAIASMFTGNFLALMQKNVKRILAYSSITHLGYLLIAVIASQFSGIKAGTFYIVAYMITIIGAFAIVSVLSPCEKDIDDIEDYKGLFWRRPWIAAIFSTALFSLAGIPLTIGFFAKFYLITAGIESYLWLLIIMLVINSAISIYYYLRIVVAMFTPDASIKIQDTRQILNARIGISSSVALAVIFIFLIWLGIYPTGIMHVIDVMAKL